MRKYEIFCNHWGWEWQKIEVEVTVTAEVFEVFKDDRKLKERQRNERRLHYDKRRVEDYIIANEQSRFLKSAEDYILIEKQ